MYSHSSLYHERKKEKGNGKREKEKETRYVESKAIWI